MTHRRREPGANKQGPTGRPAKSFSEQARAVLRHRLALGESRHLAKQRLRFQGLDVRGTMSTGMIHSVRSFQTYTGLLAFMGRWLHQQYGFNRLNQMKTAHVETFLQEKAGQGLSQKQLNNYRTAARHALAHFTKRPFHEVIIKGPKGASPGAKPRAYSQAQVDVICGQQSDRMRISTFIVRYTGLRGEELFQIHRVDDPARLARWEQRQQAQHQSWVDAREKWQSSQSRVPIKELGSPLRPTIGAVMARPLPLHERIGEQARDFHPDRFVGLSGHLYEVVGKGGLRREVVLPTWLAEQLEARRLDVPHMVVDRGIRYVQHYDIGAGSRWERSFSEISRRQLGFSNGAHGLRHTYAQQRLDFLVSTNLYTRKEALLLVAAELGHFRPDVTDRFYLR